MTCSTRCQMVLPLLGGEGRGEGEPFSNCMDRDFKVDRVQAGEEPFLSGEKPSVSSVCSCSFLHCYGLAPPYFPPAAHLPKSSSATFSFSILNLFSAPAFAY